MLILQTIFLFCLTCGLSKEQFNLREHCDSQHAGNRSSVSCDGNHNRRIKENIKLSNSSISGVDELTLVNIDNVYLNTFNRKENIKKLLIKNSKTVNLDIQLNIKELNIDSVEELLLKLNDSHSLSGNNMTLSNIEKITLNNASLHTTILNITTAKDLNFETGSLVHLTGINLLTFECNIDVKENSFVNIDFTQNVVLNRSVLYVRRNATLNITANEVTLIDSELFVDGMVNITGRKTLGKPKSATKFHRNTFYSFGNKCFQLNTVKDIEYLKNDIINIDISSIIDWIGEINKTDKIIFLDNKFTWIKYTHVFAIMPKNMGDANYCYTDCNLTLRQHIIILREYQLCDEDGQELNCSTLGSPYNKSPDYEFVLNCMPCCILILLVVILIVILVCFCSYKMKQKKKFQTAAICNVPSVLNETPNNEEIEVLAFSNLTYSNEGSYEDLDQIVNEGRSNKETKLSKFRKITNANRGSYEDHGYEVVDSRFSH